MSFDKEIADACLELALEEKKSLQRIIDVLILLDKITPADIKLAKELVNVGDKYK